MVEAQELIEIYAGLKNREDAHLADLLRKYIGGTPLRTQETPLTSLARNTGFHLWFVSNAAKCDVPIDLTPPADATIPTSDYSITVECKDSSAPGILNRISKKDFSSYRNDINNTTGRLKYSAFWHCHWANSVSL